MRWWNPFRFQQLERRVRHGGFVDQLLAVRELGELRDERVLPLLIEVLEDQASDSLRDRAAEVLGERGDPRAGPALLKAADHARRTLPRLPEGAAGARSAVLRASVRALGKLGERGAVDLLVRELAEADPERKALAAEALVALDWRPSGPEERAHLAVLQGRYREAAAEGAASIKPLLDAYLHGMAGAAVALRSVVQMRGAAVEPLLRLLAEGHPRAPEALAKIRDPRAVEPLRALLQGPARDPAFREAAAEALERLGDPATLSTRPRPLPALDAEAGDPFREFAFSPDGALLAGLGIEVVVWSVAGGAMLRAFPAAQALAFSPDGKLVTCGSDAHVRFWDPRSGALLWSLEARAGALAFPSGEETWVSLDGMGLATLWDLRTGAPIRSIQGPAGGTALSADGRVAVSMEFNEEYYHPRFIAWSTATGELLGRMEGEHGPVDCVALSADGRLFAYGNDWPVFSLFDTATGEHLRSVSTEAIHSMPDVATESFAVAFSPDGMLLATSQEGAPCLLWQVASGEPDGAVARVKVPGSVGLAFSPDGRLLAGG